MRAWDVNELKATLKVFEDPTVIIDPMSRARAYNIASALIKREIERWETGEEIDDALTKAVLIDEPAAQSISTQVIDAAWEQGYNVGWRKGAKAIMGLTKKSK